MAIAVLPNPNMDFTPFDILPASDLDKIVANIEALAGATIAPANANMALFRDFFYPVGTYYETSDTTFNPNTAWGGTWVEDTSGRVTVAQDSGTFSTVGDTGGEETHTLTIAEMPSHYHAVRGNLKNQGSGPEFRELGSESSTNSGRTENTGGDGAHNNLQPYIVIKRWHRTA